MAKLYEYKVSARNTPKGSTMIHTSTIIASSVNEAKNKLKAKHPYADIISCVKGKEVSENNAVGTTVGTALFGLAVAGGIALFNKLKNSDK